MSDDLFKSLMSSTWPMTVGDLLLPTGDDQLAPNADDVAASPMSSLEEDDFDMEVVEVCDATFDVSKLGISVSAAPAHSFVSPLAGPLPHYGSPAQQLPPKREALSHSSSDDEHSAHAPHSYVDPCSEEEINRLLSMPPRYCTPEEREIRKKAKNRMAAQESRKRKKARSDIIGGTLSQLQEINTSYEAQVQTLSAANGRLTREIQYLREVLKAAGASNPILARVAQGESLSADAIAMLADEEALCEACTDHEARRKRQRTA